MNADRHGAAEKETEMKEIFVRLLFTACGLMLLAGCIFALMKWWLCAVLLGVGALGCLSGAIGMKNRKDA